MKILFKYPTRDRAEWFRTTLSTYYKMLSTDCDFEFVLTLDNNDLSMNNADIRRRLDFIPKLSYHFGNSASKIEACNANIDMSKPWDIIVLVSDDMIPVVEDFDKIIVAKMMEYFPDTDGALHFHDGLFGKDNTITLSILGRKLYERFGYLYHPDYKSFYCDNEFTDVVRKMNKHQYIPQTIIKHAWSGGQQSEDALYRRNSKLGCGDEKTYERRKALGFPI